MPAPAPATRAVNGADEAARLADEAAAGRVVISGSLPPDARDLDLVVRVDDEQRIAEALRGAGFHQHGGEWVRFRACTAEAVDLIPAADWELPVEEMDRLFAEAVPVDGYEHLARPAPAHLLLMLSRRLVGGDGRLDGKRRARVELPSRSVRMPGPQPTRRRLAGGCPARSRVYAPHTSTELR